MTEVTEVLTVETVTLIVYYSSVRHTIIVNVSVFRLRKKVEYSTNPSSTYTHIVPRSPLIEHSVIDYVSVCK